MPAPLDDLPTPRDADIALVRVQQLFDPRPKIDAVLTARDRLYQELARRTGLPTPQDLYDAAEDRLDHLAEEIKDEVEAVLNAPPESGDGDGWGPSWTDVVIALAGAYAALNYQFEVTLPPLEFEIPGFEFDPNPSWGYATTQKRLYQPGPPYAARVLDPMLHAGAALPGPGNPSVLIGQRPALTTSDVAICPGVTPWGFKHVPGPFVSTNHSVLVGGAALLRAGDFMLEPVGGANPIISGCPTVTVGAPAPPVVVEEAVRKQLGRWTDFDKVGFTGRKISLQPTLKFSAGNVIAFLPGVAPPLQRLAKVLFDEPTISVEGEWDSGMKYAEKAEVEWRPDEDGDGMPERVIKRTRYEGGRARIKGKCSGTAQIPDVWNSKLECEMDEEASTWRWPQKRTQEYPAGESPKPWDEE